MTFYEIIHDHLLSILKEQIPGQNEHGQSVYTVVLLIITSYARVHFTN